MVTRELFNSVNRYTFYLIMFDHAAWVGTGRTMFNIACGGEDGKSIKIGNSTG